MRCLECEHFSKAPVQIKDLKELLKNKSYLCLVRTLLILFAMGCADIYLVVDKILSINGTSFHVGLKWGLQSLAEAPYERRKSSYGVLLFKDFLR